MFSFLNPWVILGALLALAGLYGYAHHAGYKERDAEMQAMIAEKNEEARKHEQESAQKLNQTATQLQEANNVLNEKQSALDRAIRAGKLRISKPASCVQTNASAPTATGDRDTTGSQPNGQVDEASDAERQTLAAIAALVAEGDRNTQQLNACITAYNAIREKVNAQQ